MSRLGPLVSVQNKFLASEAALAVKVFEIMSVLVEHFVKEPKIFIEIEKFNLGKEESERLTQLVTLLYHQKLLNRFLDYLEEEDKKVFLELVVAGTNENYLEFLHQKIGNLEEVVVSAITDIESQIMEDLTGLVEVK